MTAATTLGDDEALFAAYPWPEGRWLRANMVMSLDGASVGPDGLSRSLSSPGDQRVFRSLRAFADVVLVGAATIRAERYRPMRPAAEVRSRREAAGLAPAPVLTVLSGTLQLPWAEPMFSDSTIRPIVLTGEGADVDRLAEAREHADVVELPGRSVDPTAILDALEARNLRRILCEGGARLLGQLVEADLLDEADVTIAPVFAGSALTPRSPVLAPPRRFTLAHSIVDDGSMINRYVRSDR